MTGPARRVATHVTRPFTLDTDLELRRSILRHVERIVDGVVLRALRADLPTAQVPGLRYLQVCRKRAETAQFSGLLLHFLAVRRVQREVQFFASRICVPAR